MLTQRRRGSNLYPYCPFYNPIECGFETYSHVSPQGRGGVWDAVHLPDMPVNIGGKKFT
ncbi:hypothetical protein F441_09502 [Phytophthora nicotianae CJ01A1]|uniref:Uncharacterized protein n=2 Tax=Phytophthora nicotianae TaxID=4792 RepID=W2WZP7_PHYNI|nr:hypothetical protein F444_05202 [Phytophthora nicotianae P1976]ETP15752.1 hypothetical protein F441_09502 [Phytophthora nicotianae CJ01A1]